MKKIIPVLFPILALGLFVSCEEPKDEITYAPVTQDVSDEVVPYWDAVFSTDLYGRASTAINEVYAGNVSETFDGDGYSGSVTYSETGFSSQMSCTLVDEPVEITVNGSPVSLILNGTYTWNFSYDGSEVENGYGTYVSRSYGTENYTFTGGDISTIVSDFSFVYTGEQSQADDEGYEPDTSISGTVTVDGVNYRLEELVEFAPQ